MKSKMCAFIAIVLIAAMAPVWAEVATDGLVVHFRADNADGAGNPGSGKLATWKDLALEYGQANNGKLNHSIGMQQKPKFKFTSGSGWVENTDQPKDSPFRFGLGFKASDRENGDYILVEPPSFVDEDSFTYEIWMKPETKLYNLTKGRAYLIGEYKRDRNVMKSHMAHYFGGGVRFNQLPQDIGTGFEPAPDGFVPRDEFVQLVLTKSGNDVSVYVNGGGSPKEVYHCKMTAKNTGVEPNQQVIGTRFGFRPGMIRNFCSFTGQMSIVRIYNRPLSPKEVAGNYAAKLSKPAPQKGQLTMKPATDSFSISADVGPKMQTISLPAGRKAPAGGTPVTIRYNEGVVRVYSDSSASKPLASGGKAKISQGKSSVSIYVKGYSEGSCEVRSWTPGIFGGRAKYKVAVVPVPGPNGIATDGLVVAYRADDADGAGNPGTVDRKTWTDLATKDGVRNNGQLFHFKFQKGSGWVENTDQPKNSPFRYGLDFEATTHYNGDYVNISPLAEVKADSFTYEFWIKPDKDSYTHLMTLIGQYAGNTGNNVLGTSVTGWVFSAQPRKDGGTSWSGPDNFRPIGKFVQLVVTKKGKDLFFYVNGADTPAKTAHVVQTEKHAATAPNRQCLGMYWGSDGRLLNAFNGQMSIVRVYRRPLSAREVAGNYAAEMGQPTPKAGLAGGKIDNGAITDFVVRPDSDGNHIEVHHGGVLFVDGKYWWYGQTFHRVPKGRNVWPATKTGVAMYSSEDLSRWKYEGVILACQPSGDLEGPMRFERVKIIYNDQTKKFVMWFHYIEKDPGNVVKVGRADAGVASCDEINGTYKWHGYQRPLGPSMTVKDCTLFKEKDGKAYFIFDSYPTNRSTARCIYVARLSDDYLKTIEVRKIPKAQHREAPAMIKKNGYYFLLTSGVTGFDTNASKYFRAKNIFGPYTDLGEFCVGPRKDITFNSQSTYILELNDKPGSFIFMGDRWKRDNMRYSSHIWLPLEFPTDDTVEIRYHKVWDLSLFDRSKNTK